MFLRMSTRRRPKAAPEQAASPALCTRALPLGTFDANHDRVLNYLELQGASEHGLQSSVSKLPFKLRCRLECVDAFSSHVRCQPRQTNHVCYVLAEHLAAPDQ